MGNERSYYEIFFSSGIGKRPKRGGITATVVRIFDALGP